MKKTKTPLQDYCAAILAAALGISFMLNSKEVAGGISRGLLLCAQVLVPALFPFMALSCWLSLTGASRVLSVPLAPITTRLFKLPRELGAVVLLSFVGGYPVGAKNISLLLAHNRIDQRTAERMLCFCVNAGPPFVISAVGAGMLGDRAAGIALLAGQICASVFVGFIASRKIKTPQSSELLPPAPKVTGAEAFVEAVSAAGAAVLNMCAYAVLFAGALSLFSGTAPIPDSLKAMVAGFLEVASGCAEAAGIGGAAGLAIISACLSFGGLSVWFQIMSCFQGAEIRFERPIKSRVPHAFISIVTSLALYKRLGGAQTVFAPTAAPLIISNSRHVFLACCLLFMCAILTLDCHKIDKNRRYRIK